MSLLPPQAIDEFQQLWKKHYGTELPREQAVVRAHQVFTLVKMLVESPPPPDDWQPDVSFCDGSCQGKAH